MFFIPMQRTGMLPSKAKTSYILKRREYMAIKMAGAVARCRSLVGPGELYFGLSLS
jgi:hypothetical protein